MILRVGEVETERWRGLSFVVSMRIIVRDFERGRWMVACLVWRETYRRNVENATHSSWVLFTTVSLGMILDELEHHK